MTIWVRSETGWTRKTTCRGFSTGLPLNQLAVRGALGFGLKAVATAFHSLGLIETDWADSPIDGLGAMVGAWRCDGEAKEQAVPMGQLPLMNEIAHYNEVDCKLMMEIVCYLRASH